VDLAKLNDDLINLLGCVDIPIVMVGLNGRIRRFTPKAGNMLNLIPSDVGRPISDINPNFDKLNLGSLVSEVIETIKIKEMNIKDHKGRWFRLQVRPYKTIENKIEGAVISLVDINLLTQNLIESKVSLDYATSIANTVHLPLVVLDKQLRLKSANPAFYEKFHVTTKDEKSDLLTLIGAMQVSQVRKALNKAFISNVELKDFEVEYKLSSSIVGSMLFNGRRIQWLDEDEPNALLLCMQDITDRIKMETSLKEAIAVSKKANQSKDIFLATLSHELRTPLTAILCWSQLLLTIEEGSDKLKHGLKAIEQNSRIQGQLIDDLLDVTRIQSGKLALSISQLDPCAVVRTTVESIRQLAESKSLTIKIHAKPLNGNVAADPARLQQILWNLLINAIKFSPPKKGIDVRISPVGKRGQPFAAIEVIDHGKGIKPDFLPQLFERFTQADKTTTRLYGGVGLGLTIASDLLKLQGGSIRAKSDGEGKGATFTVLLPLIPNTAKLEMKAPFEEVVLEKETIPWQSLRGLCVLIVEDELSSLEVFTELLNSAGAKTISVTSAAEAMIALDKNKPDILISDIALPGEDGISLIQNIRARGTKQGGQMPAVALSAYAAKEDINRALSGGFNVHLAKPFNAVDLIVCIAKLAKGRQKS
jgi:two-component system, chemotaxis family, CheB/CheR fusion protein